MMLPARTAAGSLTEAAFLPSDVPRANARVAEDVVSDFLKREHPIVILGAADHWKALGRWTPEYLRNTVGQTPVRVMVSDDLLFRGDPLQPRQSMSIAQYIDQLTLQTSGSAQTRYYLDAVSIPNVLPTLMEDIDTPGFIPPGRLSKTNLWFGSAGTIAPLHYDSAPNLLTQVRGQKRVVLFARGQHSKLYPYPSGSRRVHISQVNIDHPDPVRHPRFANLRAAYQTTIGPGDILFIPFGWWHQVYSVDVCLSVNFWWRPTASQFINPTGLRILFDRTRRRLRRIFEDPRFEHDA